MHNIVFVFCNIFYTNMINCFYYVHIFLFRPGFVRKRFARRGNHTIDEDGSLNEREFFPGIEVWKEFDKSPLPEHIKTFLEDL